MTALPGGAATCRSRSCIDSRKTMLVVLVVSVYWAQLSINECSAASGADQAGESNMAEDVAEGGGGGSGSSSSSFEMPLVYRYSEQFLELTKGRPGWEHVASKEWPRDGSPEFYHALVMEDRHRHASRNLLTADDVYSLSPNATTFYLPSLGAIHYGFIELGTPPKTFLVGLDTGSDLLWVPCDCQQCSVANWTAYGIEFPGSADFAIYSPSNSSTSKVVACNSDICTSSLSPSACDVDAPQSCTYVSNYLSANTSSSGKIVQDVIYLYQENKTGPQKTANIYFGCGTTQTGDFVEGGAPDGLFGLGPEVYSVPVTLGSTAVIENVFSMCFRNSVGRLVFGKKPATSLQSTPLIPTIPNIYYVVGLEGIVVGGKSFKVAGRVVFDTGTSITSLPSDVIKVVGDAMASTTTLKSWAFNYASSVQFDYCWNATTNAELDSLSSLSFIFGGGGTWEIKTPILGFVDNGVLEFVCLGMMASNVPIIGYNFMAQYEYFFDLNSSTFSWGPSDCSSSNSAKLDVVPSDVPSPSPQSPSTSSKTPTSKAEEPPPLIGIPRAPMSAAPGLSKAYRNSSQFTPFQVVYLTILTMVFHLIANIRS